MLQSRWCVALAIGLAGCGGGTPSLVKVTGMVTLDGAPVPGAAVMFVPTPDTAKALGGFSATASGETGPDGSFTLKTMDKDGVAAGVYLVGVVLTKMEGAQKFDPNTGQLIPEGGDAKVPEFSQNADDVPPPPKVVYIIPATFGDPQQSGLTAKVTKSGLEPQTIAVTSQ